MRILRDIPYAEAGIYPDIITAYGMGKSAYPAGPRQSPEWWAWGQRLAYDDGWWHACWTTAERTPG